MSERKSQIIPLKNPFWLSEFEDLSPHLTMAQRDEMFWETLRKAQITVLDRSAAGQADRSITITKLQDPLFWGVADSRNKDLLIIIMNERGSVLPLELFLHMNYVLEKTGLKDRLEEVEFPEVNFKTQKLWTFKASRRVTMKVDFVDGAQDQDQLDRIWKKFFELHPRAGDAAWSTMTAPVPSAMPGMSLRSLEVDLKLLVPVHDLVVVRLYTWLNIALNRKRIKIDFSRRLGVSWEEPFLFSSGTELEGSKTPSSDQKDVTQGHIYETYITEVRLDHPYPHPSPLRERDASLWKALMAGNGYAMLVDGDWGECTVAKILPLSTTPPYRFRIYNIQRNHIDVITRQEGMTYDFVRDAFSFLKKAGYSAPVVCLDDVTEFTWEADLHSRSKELLDINLQDPDPADARFLSETLIGSLVLAFLTRFPVEIISYKQILAYPAIQRLYIKTKKPVSLLAFCRMTAWLEHWCPGGTNGKEDPQWLVEKQDPFGQFPVY